MITNYQTDILKRMLAGERLCKHHGENGDEYTFDSGEVVRANSVRSLFNQGIIRGSDDGMFGDAQTYEVNFIPKD